MAAAAQTIQSADGTVPVVIAEYGPSTTGMYADPNGIQSVTAVINAGANGKYGSAAWHWGQQDCCNNLSDGSGTNATSPYGQMLQLYINTSVVTPSQCRQNQQAQAAADAATVAAQQAN
jgi:hypothetical protein